MGRTVTALVTYGNACVGVVGPASQHVDLTGPPAQRKTWNLAGLFRLPTVDGPVWLKAIPPFAAAEPLAHLAYAVRYQEFLDNIEPSERVYHLGDPAAVIRHALASTRTQDRL